MTELKDSPRITRCGYRCDLCLAYKQNIDGREDKQVISDGWFEYFGFRIPPEKISCDGCLTPDKEKPHLIEEDCPIRACVIDKGIDNCSQCEEFGCEKFETRVVDGKEFEDIPDKDYSRFIRPYENKRRFKSD
ncbi:MAG: DUF3795 domain-containing protein [Thermoplasmata archaeon]